MLYDSLNIYKIIIETIGTFFFLTKSHNYIGKIGEKKKGQENRVSQYANVQVVGMGVGRWLGWRGW